MTSPDTTPSWALENGALYSGQDIAWPLADRDLLQNYCFISMRPDGSRLVDQVWRLFDHDAALNLAAQVQQDTDNPSRHPVDNEIRFLHLTRDEVANHISRNKYTFVDHDNTLSAQPVSQIPHLYWGDFGAWMVHACIFAHHVEANFRPGGWLREHPEYYDGGSVSTAHQAESDGRDRVALRYGQAVIGLGYGRLKLFERLSAAGGAWKRSLTQLGDYDDLLCDTCGGNHHWLREFVRSMSSPTAWEAELDRTYSQPSSARPGQTIDSVKLPGISKTTGTDGEPLWSPDVSTAGTLSQMTINSDDPLGAASYGRQLRSDYVAAVKRWDREDGVREPVYPNRQISVA